jgi:hypothetical protein
LQERGLSVTVIYFVVSVLKWSWAGLQVYYRSQLDTQRLLHYQIKDFPHPQADPQLEYQVSNYLTLISPMVRPPAGQSA